MKISVCITVLNEEGSIGKLLESLLKQTKKPDEIIVIDASSADNTVRIINHWQKKDKRIKLLIEKGNIAHGRNTSIDLAKNEIVALTDAGCIARMDWLEKISEPFKNEKIRIVAGFYVMEATNSFQEALNVYNGVPPERFDINSFIPSARSVAFRKKVWEEIGGFKESLSNAGEDTRFFYEAIRKSIRIVRVREAVVVWEETKRMTFNESVRKFRRYAIGDAQTGIWWHPGKRGGSHNIKISAIFIRYFTGFILLLLSFKYFTLFYLICILSALYFVWPVWKWKDVIKNWKARVWLPVIQITSDFAVMSGFLTGLLIK